MEKFKSYETAKAPTEAGERLPVGGYIVKILSAEEIRYDDGGRALKISFDINEGEHKGFYQNNYKSQKEEDKKWKGVYTAYVPKEDGSEMDEWTANSFKGMTDAVEDSNTGYHWDWNEAGLKGKIVGAVFFNKEYAINGKQGFYTACHSFRSVKSIREGKFKIPADKLLKKSSNAPSGNIDGFVPVDCDDLPFN